MSETLKILVVDDCNIDTALICRCLKNATTRTRYQTESLSEAENIYEKVQSFRPDCILLDYNLIGVKGIEVLEQMKTKVDFKKVAVVVITGIIEEHLIEQVLSRGAVGYIPKNTITEESLPIFIKTALEKIKLDNLVLEKNYKIMKLLSLLSHDLRNCVGAISASAEFIINENLCTPAAENYLRIIASQSRDAIITMDTYIAEAKS